MIDSRKLLKRAGFLGSLFSKRSPTTSSPYRPQTTADRLVRPHTVAPGYPGNTPEPPGIITTTSDEHRIGHGWIKHPPRHSLETRDHGTLEWWEPEESAVDNLLRKKLR